MFTPSLKSVFKILLIPGVEIGRGKDCSVKRDRRCVMKCGAVLRGTHHKDLNLTGIFLGMGIGI